MRRPELTLVKLAIDPPRATLTLNDPARRNALGREMFAQLARAFEALSGVDDVQIVLLRGEGKSFCAGFDLDAAVNDMESPTSAMPLLEQFIRELSALNRAIRRLPQVVVAAVQGHALAGGCAMLSACDFVVAAPDATLGYPVHRIGVSPAVTLPLLRQAMGDGRARELVLGGELIDGREAHRRGLATHLSDSAESLLIEAQDLCERLAQKGPKALRATKQWLNELDGSSRDEAFDATAAASAGLVKGEEGRQMLRAAWAARKR